MIGTNHLRVLTRLSSAIALVFGLLTHGCAGMSKTPKEQQKLRTEGFTVDDQSRCDWQGRTDREVTETTAVGAFQPNVRRVYQLVGVGFDRKRVLICREVDTNLDGVKDVVRLYTEKGELQREEADTTFDGRVDSWMAFADSHVVKHELDRNGDGKPDVWKFYMNGKLSRVHRDTNFDGKPDGWEIYAQGKLDRIGTDLDFDGHVDRWDRDEQVRLMEENKEKQEIEQQEQQRQEEQKDSASDAKEGSQGARGPAAQSRNKPETTAR